MPRNWLSARSSNDTNSESYGVRRISNAVSSEESRRLQSYGTTTLHGRSQAILGNVYHTYHHYHGSKDARQRADETQSTADRSNPDLQVSNTINDVPIDSISDYDPEWALWLRRTDRLPDTCQWVFKSRAYQDWQSGRGPSTLFCTGSVGCGKSIAASAVVDALALDSTLPESLVISYFVDTSQNQTPAVRDVIRALVKQVVIFTQKTNVQLSGTLQDRLRIVLTRTPNHFPLDTFTQIFKDLTTHCAQCTVIIDGLDALKEDDIIQCLQFSHSITSNGNPSGTPLKTIIFCRETLGRGIHVEDQADSAALQISLRHVEHDIHRVIDHAVAKKQQERFITKDTALMAEIVEVLKTNSARMFLWAKLQIESLWNPNLITTDASIREQLRSLPKNLDETYLLCLKRIQETNLAASQFIAPMVFRWISSASRPLCAAEAQELVSMDYMNEPVTTNDQLLNCPVIDYCANLVVFNHHSGQIEFAHPTVKSFLSDPSKIPLQFKDYCLPSMDGMRCGHLCLIYLDQYRKQNQVAVGHKLQISPKVAPPVLRVMSETWPALRWASAKIQKKRQLSSENSIQFAAPAGPKSSLLEANNAAHGYIRHNWLWHTSCITQTHADFTTFSELCVCHNADFQAWSEPQRKGPDHYARLVAYAVTANHPPLLQIATDELIYHHNIRQVFHQPCIGSDSGLLHVAAALGHTAIAKLLLPHTLDYADFQGKSAAAIAVEYRRNEVLAAIVAANSPVHSFGSFERRLETFRPGPPVSENLLNVCAAAGNLEATKIVLSALSKVGTSTRGSYLSAAVSNACYKGYINVADHLMEHGARPNFVDARLLDLPSLVSPLAGLVNPLQLALKARDLTFFDSLLALGADRSGFVPDIHFGDLLTCLGTSGPVLESFMTSIALRQGFNSFPSDADRLSLLESHILWSSGATGQMLKPYNRLLRLLLTNLRHEDIATGLRNVTRTIPGETSGQARKLDDEVSTRIPIYDTEVESWLSVASDDILIHLLCHPCIGMKYLVSPSCVKILANRPTSRALETLLKHDVREYERQLNFNSLRQCLGFRRTSHVASAGYCGPSPNNLEVEPDLHALMQLRPSYNSQSASTDPYLRAKYDILTTAAQYSNHQTLELFACTICPQFTMNMMSRWREAESYHYGLFQAFRAAGEMMYGTEALRWVRCLILRKGDIVAAQKVYTELSAQGSDMNFALNWPSGYARTECNDRSKRLCFHKAILFGVYGWNFRLRRSLKKQFSQADVWYIGMKLIFGLRHRDPHRSKPRRSDDSLFLNESSRYARFTLSEDESSSSVAMAE